MNSFEINITKEDFMSKAPSEQSWILFQGVSSVNKCVDEINLKGCEFAKKKRRISTLKILSAISGGATFAIGIVYIIYQITCK